MHMHMPNYKCFDCIWWRVCKHGICVVSHNCFYYTSKPECSTACNNLEIYLYTRLSNKLDAQVQQVTHTSCTCIVIWDGALWFWSVIKTSIRSHRISILVSSLKLLLIWCPPVKAACKGGHLLELVYSCWKFFRAIYSSHQWWRSWAVMV